MASSAEDGAGRKIDGQVSVNMGNPDLGNVLKEHASQELLFNSNPIPTKQGKWEGSGGFVCHV